VPAFFGAATAATLLTVHPLGIAVMGWRLGMSASEAVATGAVFLPGDLIKNVLAAVVAAAAVRAFPDLLRGR
jgi:biotin transport system substrate-specific component